MKKLSEMTKLKTLKDLECWEGRDDCWYMEVDKVKQEAIKLFKSKKVLYMTAQDFIYWWFNLIEEDLK